MWKPRDTISTSHVHRDNYTCVESSVGKFQQDKEPHFLMSEIRQAVEIAAMTVGLWLS